MGVSHVKNIKGISMNGNNDVMKKILISSEEGWQDYVMRLFEINPGEDNCSPKHSHEWPHIIYIVEGNGIIHLDGTDHEVEAGSYAYIPGGKIHQLANTGTERFSFICIVPSEGEV